MNTALMLLKDPGYWALLLTLAAPLLLGVIGELICERAGVMNLGIAGIFVAGALAALLMSQASANPWDGVIVAGAVGIGIGFVYGLLVGPMRLQQPMTGIAVTMIAIAVCYFVVLALFAEMARVPSVKAVAAFEGLAALPDLIARIPIIGTPLSHSAAMTFLTQVVARTSLLAGLAVAAAAVAAYILYRTPLGLVLRACGNNPHAVISQGHRLNTLRVSTVAIGSGLMATGGAAMVLGASGPFNVDTIAGNGFLCLALVTIAVWRIGWAILAVLVFAAMQALQAGLVQSGGDGMAAQTVAILPYVLAIVGLVLMSRNRRRPRALPFPPHADNFSSAA